MSSLEDDEAVGNEALETEGTYAYDQYTNLLAYVVWGQEQVVYDYDDNANTVSTNDRTYVYDSSNQLIEVWDGANQIAGYTYNGAGQRIKKVTQSGTRIFHYDLWGHLIAETNQSGQMIAEYIYLGEKLLAMIRKPAQTEIVSYFHNDHLGTPLILTNDNQTIVWKAAYTPFGAATISVQTVENPFRLPGQYYDQETGLHYNYFRYYNPGTGRYVTPDPIGLEGGVNLFLYAVGNPLRWIDPFGLHSLIFKGGTLTYYDDKGKPVSSYPATSGSPGVTDPKVKWEGPIPPGTYTLYPSEISEGGFLRSLTGDWGQYRVPLHPDKDTNTYGRKRFFLHGGKEPGSAGCIDVGDKDKELFPELMKHKEPIPLMVR